MTDEQIKKNQEKIASGQYVQDPVLGTYTTTADTNYLISTINKDIQVNEKKITHYTKAIATLQEQIASQEAKKAPFARRQASDTKKMQDTYEAMKLRADHINKYNTTHTSVDELKSDDIVYE